MVNILAQKHNWPTRSIINTDIAFQFGKTGIIDPVEEEENFDEKSHKLINILA